MPVAMYLKYTSHNGIQVHACRRLCIISYITRAYSYTLTIEYLIYKLVKEK